MRKAVREETRRRIVSATADLHREHGILGTSHAMIAERADVSVPTVYNHFRTRSELVQACGAHIAASAPAMNPGFPGKQRGLRAMLAATVAAIGGDHAYRAPWLVHILHEAEKVPELKASFTRQAEHRRHLLQQALRPFLRTSLPDDLLILGEALLNFSTWKTLTIDRGLSRERAESLLVDALDTLCERYRRSSRRKEKS